jgi:ElaB/YqjD/DUF883 family membrane-anchored ribosome-binding protein
MKLLFILIAAALVGCGASEAGLQQQLAKAETAQENASAALRQAETAYMAAVSERVGRMVDEEAGVPRSELARLTAENERLFADLDRQSDAEAKLTEARIEANLEKHRMHSEKLTRAVASVENRVAAQTEASLYGSLPESQNLEAAKSRAREAAAAVEAIRDRIDE